MSSGGFPAAARRTLRDAQLRRNLAKATTTIRAKRVVAVAELDDWQALRDAGAAIKDRALATLPEQLERLEAAVTRAGVRTMHLAEVLAASATPEASAASARTPRTGDPRTRAAS